MKAINVGMKCARCKMETGECVKMHDFETGQEVCYDTNVIDTDKATGELITRLCSERNYLAKAARISAYITIALAVLVLIFIFRK